MILLGRDVAEVEALVTDRYLDALLMEADVPGIDPMAVGTVRRRRPWFLTALGLGSSEAEPARLDGGVRLASERLTRDLPRFHPSFRFEERLAVRLAEAAAAMHLPLAAGGESVARVVPLPAPIARVAAGTAGSDEQPTPNPRDPRPRASAPRPILVSGAVAASALSLAGAVWVAWRRARVHESPMARAARAAHGIGDRTTPAMRGRPA